MAKTDAEASRAAQGLADHFNTILNLTVSRSRLTLLSEKGTSPPHFDLLRRVEGQTTPLELNGSSAYLSVQHKIEVVDGHCRTLTYSYRYQLNKDPRSSVCRWEFFRKPPKPDYPYPLAHFHVDTDPDGDVDGKHFPTSRVPLEWILLHLIEEWGVKPLSRDWRAALMESIEGFEKRRTSN